MRLLWHSVAPWVAGGYGRVCQEVTTRLQNETHHEVAVQCLTSVKKDPVMWHGEVWDEDSEGFVIPRELDEPIPVFPSSSNRQNTHFGVKEAKGHFEDFNADFYFTHFDTWMNPARDAIPQMNIPYGSYVIVDHYPCPVEVVEQVSSAYETIAMSRFAEDALMERGIRSRYIPHGVDTEMYRPMNEDERATKLRNELDGEETIIDLTDKFVIGMIAANYSDRKNIPHHMEAFKMFLDEVDDEAILYMHMHQNVNVGYDLYQVQKEIGIPDENIVWVPPDLYHDVGDITLADWYNNMDFLMNCSFGESWGLTITEAMACGTPAIVTSVTSMPEQVGYNHDRYTSDMEIDSGMFDVANHGLVVHPDTSVWREKVNSKQYMCGPRGIFSAMRYYYNNRDTLEEHGKKSRAHVVSNYDWDNCVIPRFKEMFNEIEEILV